MVDAGCRAGCTRLLRVASECQCGSGQNFLADPNLLEAIVADAELGPGDVVLEVGGGEGALTERLAAARRSACT